MRAQGRRGAGAGQVGVGVGLDLNFGGDKVWQHGHDVLLFKARPLGLGFGILLLCGRGGQRLASLEQHKECGILNDVAVYKHVDSAFAGIPEFWTWNQGLEITAVHSGERLHKSETKKTRAQIC